MKQIGLVTGRAIDGWIEDNASQMAAALAYYTLFAIGPLLLVSVSVAGLFFGQEAARGELASQMEFLVGPTAAGAIQAFFSQTNSQSSNRLNTIVGLGVLLVGATTVFLELKADFNHIWHVKAKERDRFENILHYLLRRLVSFALVLGLGFLLLVSLVISAVLSAVTNYFSGLVPLSSGLLHSLDLLISYILIGGIFLALFRFLPDTPVRWGAAAKGALLTSLLFTLGKIGIGFYLGQSAFSSTYGASASVIIILLWTYYSTLILFFGAEVTKAIQQNGESKSVTPPKP